MPAAVGLVGHATAVVRQLNEAADGWSVADNGAEWIKTLMDGKEVRKRPGVLPTTCIYTHMIALPRQAWVQHRENSKKINRFLTDQPGALG